MNDRKNKYQIVLFASVMLLTFYAVFQKKDLLGIWNAIIRMELGNFIIAISLGLFFVSAEGITIWYLLVSLGNKCSIWRCIKYSFIGFFYSGITPSATGGQPVQLYYMKRDGYKTSDSSVILMTVALAYKLVLVLIGVCLFFLWYRHLKYFMKDSDMLGLLTMFLVVVIGAYKVISGAVLVGTLVALVQLSNSFVNPIMEITMNIPKMQSTRKIMEKINKLCSQKNVEKTRLLSFREHIEYQDVWFSYDNQNYALKGITLKFEKGKKYLILGKSGCGKSTLIYPVMNHYRVWVK